MTLRSQRLRFLWATSNGKKKNLYTMLQHRQPKTSEFFTLLLELVPLLHFSFPTLLSPRSPPCFITALESLFLCLKWPYFIQWNIIQQQKEWISDTYYTTDENIMLSEKSDTRGHTYFMIPFTWNVQNAQIHKDWKQIDGCLRLGY